MSVLDRILLREGSTRAVALMRILLVFVVWSRWANEVLLLRDLSAPRLALTVAFFTITAWMAVGLYTEVAKWAFAGLVCTIVFGFGVYGGLEDWAHHHTTMLANAAVFLAFTPCGRSLSLDRWRAVRAAEAAGQPPPPERGPLWGVTLLGLLVSSLYFWSAFDKTTCAFLSGQRLEQIFVELYTGSDWSPPTGAGLGFGVAGTLVVLLEYTLAFGLWVPRLRRVLIPAGLLLHGVFYALIPVYTFTVSMWTLYLAFVDPDALHDALDRLLGHPPRVQ